MAIDICSSFKAPYMDKTWLRKVVIGGIIGLVPILDLVVIGYSALYLERLLKYGQDVTLPEWTDLWLLFKRGLQVVTVSIIYLLLPIILGSMGGTVLLSPRVILSTTGMLLYAVLMLLLFLVAAGVVIFLLPVAILRLVQSGYNMGSAFEIKKITYMAKSRMKDYIIGSTAISIAFIIVFLLGFIPVLGWFIGLFASFYLTLSFTHMLSSIFKGMPEEKDEGGGPDMEPIVPE